MGRKRWVHENHEAYKKARRELLKSPGFGASATANVPPPPEVVADAERRNAAAYQSLTAQLCGDPKPGQSALDRQLAKDI